MFSHSALGFQILSLFLVQVNAQTFTSGSRNALRQRNLAQTSGQGLGTTQEGNEILAMSAEVEGFEVQFKIAAPASLLLPAAQQGALISSSTFNQAATSSNVDTAATTATGNNNSSATNNNNSSGATNGFIDLASRRSRRNKHKRRIPETKLKRQTGSTGINLLLHGDGGQSFFDFPNQLTTSQNGLVGVVALAPNDDLFWGGGSGLDRTDGVLHSQLVNALVTQVLPQVLNFNVDQTFFTGVSGGSLLLSGFTLPLFGAQFDTGALLNCGGLVPQVAGSIGNMKVHFQSTTQELDLLQGSIPAAA
ncbi:hypothetical protein BT69DRAFT_1352374, partial [Atractiella rhizophila]